MPSSAAIRDGLTAIANAWWPLAVAWHACFLAFVVSVIAGWRPSQRAAALLLLTPLVSVSALAWRAGNPFNGAVFGLVSLALAVLALKLPKEPVRLARPWIVAAGSLALAFGWTYPHFIQAEHWSTYAYAAPLGLVPCPTLTAVLGMCALLQIFRARPWSIVLALTGLGYGAIGVFKLGVTLDYGLVAAAVFTLALVASNAALKPAASFSAGPVPQ